MKPPRAAWGLTLIELMVALAIFSVLGVLSYRAVSAATEGREKLAAEFQRWRALAGFLQIAETDLLQIAARPAAPGAARAPALSVTRGREGGALELSFLRLDGAHGSVRRRGYRLEHERLWLLRWPGTDAAAPPAADIVLENVAALRVSMVSETGQKSAFWPPDPAAPALPAAVELELDLPDVGTIRRFIALR